LWCALATSKHGTVCGRADAKGNCVYEYGGQEIKADSFMYVLGTEYTSKTEEVKEQVTQKPVQVESDVRHSIDEPQGNVEDLGEKFFFCGVSKDNRGNRIPGKVF